MAAVLAESWIFLNVKESFEECLPVLEALDNYSGIDYNIES